MGRWGDGKMGRGRGAGARGVWGDGEMGRFHVGWAVVETDQIS
ncbi:hypothetical protein [Moorena sp. SIO4A1]|nr:hypothetical protein [Moorena sp. SIO4A1]